MKNGPLDASNARHLKRFMLNSRVVFNTVNDWQNGFGSMVRLRRLFHSEGKSNVRGGLRFMRSGPYVIILLFSLLMTSCSEESLSDSSDTEDALGATETIEPESYPSPTIAPESVEPELTEEVLEDEVDVEEIAEPTVTPEVDKQIVVCLGGTPAGLYPYGDDSIAALGLQHAIYESLYTSVGYEYQAQGLEKLPSVADGDAVIKKILVEEGSRVRDVDGNVVVLVKDVVVRDSAGEKIKFDGSPVEMEKRALDRFAWAHGSDVLLKRLATITKPSISGTNRR